MQLDKREALLYYNTTQMVVYFSFQGKVKICMFPLSMQVFFYLFFFIALYLFYL